MTASEIKEEALIVLKFAEEECKSQGTNYTQSWWLNKRNCPELNMETSKINSRLKLLVKEGKIEVDEKFTSKSTGTRYIIFTKAKEV